MELEPWRQLRDGRRRRGTSSSTPTNQTRYRALGRNQRQDLDTGAILVGKVKQSGKPEAGAGAGT